MSKLRIHPPPDSAHAHQLPPTADSVFGLLGRAVRYAGQLNYSVREFAVQLQDIRAAGVDATDLRWLVAMGRVQHLIECTHAQSTKRVFRRACNLAFTERSCFVLTDSRPTLARRTRDHGERFPGDDKEQRFRADGEGAHQAMPKWDPLSRTLSVGELLVKHYCVPAPCQETILTAFEEEHWPAFIYNPFHGRGAEDAKRQLHNTINALNRNQQNRLFQFRGIGCGEGVGWSLV